MEFELSLPNDKSLTDIHCQTNPAITAPRIRDFSFNDSGPPDPCFDPAHFRMSVVRIVNGLATPEAEQIAALEAARTPVSH
jgi:hypothetical protein